MSEHIPTIADAIEKTFREDDWKKIGYELGEIDAINTHSRLLRALSWGDDDYKSCVYEMLEHLKSVNEENLAKITANTKIKEWIKDNNQGAYSKIYEPDLVKPHIPKIKSGAEVVNEALNNANTLLKEHGPEHCIDRLHTALHGYLKGILDDHGISINPNESITSVFKKVISDVPPFNDAASTSAEIKKILKSMSSPIDVLNQMRNHKSLAHANPALLDKSDAVLVINSVRTISTYIGSKLGSPY